MKIVEGDLLAEVNEGLILQQVNAQGVMGSGFARAIFKRWPEVKELYQDVFLMNQFHRGSDYMGRIQSIQVQPGLFVVNMVAQQFYGKDGKKYTSYDALHTCLSAIATLNAGQNLPIHHPLIGCGLGGGYWPVVAEIIEHRLGADTTLWLLPEP